MPTLSDPVPVHQDTVITGIYIARGSETLGPYNALEAAALVVGGYLRRDDYAARNGDPNWVALADFLPLSSQTRADESTPFPVLPAPATGTRPPRRRLVAACAGLLAVSLLVVGGVRWFGRRRVDDRPVAATPPPLERPPFREASPALVAVPEVVPPAARGPLSGSLSSVLPGGERVPLAGVRVAAYPLAALAPAFDQENAEAQAARVRLDPQIDAAATDRATRAAEAQAAAQALHEADPADPLLASLRFASQGAKDALKTAEKDYRYLADERTAAAGGEVYFHGLPEPVIAQDTDSQGNFTLDLPAGEEPYVVAARVQQTSEDGSVRVRYWLVNLSPEQRAGREPLPLDDRNVSSAADAAASLIHTAD